MSPLAESLRSSGDVDLVSCFSALARTPRLKVARGRATATAGTAGVRSISLFRKVGLVQVKEDKLLCDVLRTLCFCRAYKYVKKALQPQCAKSAQEMVWLRMTEFAHPQPQCSSSLVIHTTAVGAQGCTSCYVQQDTRRQARSGLLDCRRQEYTLHKSALKFVVAMLQWHSACSARLAQRWHVRRTGVCWAIPHLQVRKSTWLCPGDCPNCPSV